MSGWRASAIVRFDLEITWITTHTIRFLLHHDVHPIHRLSLTASWTCQVTLQTPAALPPTREPCWGLSARGQPETATQWCPGSIPGRRPCSYGTMATRQPLHRELADYNKSLDNCLRSRYGMTLRTFKTIKALTQLVGAAAGIFAMHQGADPMTSFALVATIISGPEVLEFVINENGDGGNPDDTQ